MRLGRFGKASGIEESGSAGTDDNQAQPRRRHTIRIISNSPPSGAGIRFR